MYALRIDQREKSQNELRSACFFRDGLFWLQELEMENSSSSMSLVRSFAVLLCSSCCSRSEVDRPWSSSRNSDRISPFFKRENGICSNLTSTSAFETACSIIRQLNCLVSRFGWFAGSDHLGGFATTCPATTPLSPAIPSACTFSFLFLEFQGCLRSNFCSPCQREAAVPVPDRGNPILQQQARQRTCTTIDSS